MFPDCFIEGTGLTSFKKGSEYTICCILAVSALLLWWRRNDFGPQVFRLLLCSIVLTMVSELAFTVYVSVYGPANVVGHIVKVFSFYLVYKAIIETALVRPYDLIFRDLKLSQSALARANEELESKNTMFKNALAKIKTLSGMLPICASCKKICDDNGCWNHLESYISEHSDALFTHGYCPDCLKKAYEELEMVKKDG
jgi:membrane-associated sensor protein